MDWNAFTYDRLPKPKDPPPDRMWFEEFMCDQLQAISALVNKRFGVHDPQRHSLVDLIVLRAANDQFEDVLSAFGVRP
jgi:hypothetical protein